jgi:hypothetical protein
VEVTDQGDAGLGDDEIAKPDQAPPSLYDESGRPRFFADPAVDRLTSVILQLASEVWVLNERIGALESIAADKGVVTLAEIVNYAPDAAQSQRLDAARDRFVRSVLGPLREARR